MSIIQTLRFWLVFNTQTYVFNEKQEIFGPPLKVYSSKSLQEVHEEIIKKIFMNQAV